MSANLSKRFSPQQIEAIKAQFVCRYPNAIKDNSPEHIKALQLDSETYILSLAQAAADGTTNGVVCLATEINSRLHSDKSMTCFPQLTLSVIIEGTAKKQIPEGILEDLCKAGCHIDMYNEALILKYIAEGKIFPTALHTLVTLPWGYEIYKDNLVLLLDTGIIEVITDYCQRYFPEIQI